MVNVNVHRILLLVSVGCLFVLGLVMIFNTSSAEVLDHTPHRDTHQALIHHMMYGLIGGLAGLGVWYVGYQVYLNVSPVLLAIFTVLLVLVFVPGIGREANGSYRWVGLGGYTIQPSEFVKYLLPAFFIQMYLNRRKSDLSFPEFLKMCLVLGVPLALIVIEPNHGPVGVMGLMLGMLFFLTGVPLKYWAWPMLGLLVIGAALASQHPYVAARLNVYLHPESDLMGKGHQPYQAKIAAGSGQLFGRGPGQSLQKMSYLPEAQNDYIAAIFGEEFGFLGMLGLITLYMTIAYVGFSIAARCPDREGCYMAAAITFLICFQAFLNLGVVSGLLPSTGLNLPLFSQGGSSLMANLMGIGLLISIDERSSSTLA